MILITGCARSGTSLTSSIFEACGGFLGSPVNGLFENTYVRDKLVKPYLTSIRVDPLGQWPLPELADLVPFDGLRSKVMSAFRNHGGKPMVYKGAKMCLMWPIWKAAFPDAAWVIVRRDDDAIADSCLRTNFMRAFDDAEGWQAWIDVHKERFSEMLKHCKDVQEVWPDRYMGDVSVLKPVIEHCGLEYDEDAIKKLIDVKKWH